MKNLNFRPNRRFKKKYDRIFRKDREAANLFLLLAEMADKIGNVKINEKELAQLMTARFENIQEYQL